MDNPNESIPVFQLRISLQDIEPEVWRRVMVRGDITLDILHMVIQEAMGWTDSHLHQFIVRGDLYTDPSFGMEDEFGEDELPKYFDESSFQLRKLLPKVRNRLEYEYDFGDGWFHDVIVEKILPANAELVNPICIDGARARPPEDVGGPHGYEQFVEEIYDPTNEEHESSVEWAGWKHDTTVLNLAEVNERLKKINLAPGIPNSEDMVFTEQAKVLWDNIPADIQVKLLNNVHCSSCRDVVRIDSVHGRTDGGDIVLEGVCATCGGKVCRLIETSQEPQTKRRAK